MRRDRTKNFLRCFCRGEPLLAVYGLDERGRLYVHIKIFKQRQLFGEIVINGGPASIRCRNCLRWHTIVFRASGDVALEETTDPVV